MGTRWRVGTGPSCSTDWGASRTTASLRDSTSESHGSSTPSFTISGQGHAKLPQENAFGAALLPHINSYANNLTTWDLYVPDVQSGTGYPGSGWCNNLIPHAKWHVQTSASLGDAARLVDEVLRLTQGS